MQTYLSSSSPWEAFVMYGDTKLPTVNK